MAPGGTGIMARTMIITVRSSMVIMGRVYMGIRFTIMRDSSTVSAAAGMGSMGVGVECTEGLDLLTAGAWAEEAVTAGTVTADE